MSIEIKGSQIKDGTVEAIDIKDGTISLNDLSLEVINTLSGNVSVGESGWNDYVISGLALSSGGVTSTEVATFLGNIQMPAFIKNKLNEGFTSVHFLHDYKKGTKVYPHIHWSHNEPTISGNVEWKIDYSYARGYNIDVFNTPTTITLLQASGPQYTHNIIETDDTNAIPALNLDTDGVLLIRVYRDAGTGNDTFAGDAFLVSLDLHYESDGFLTTEKNADVVTHTFTKNYEGNPPILDDGVY